MGDIERASARVANLLGSLNLPSGPRIAVQVEKSPEDLILYLATLRAGFVYLPLNTPYRSAEIDYFIADAEPAVFVCSPKNFGWVAQIAFKAGTRDLFTLGEIGSAAYGRNSGSLLARTMHHTEQFETVDKTTG